MKKAKSRQYTAETIIDTNNPDDLELTSTPTQVKILAA